MYKRGSRDECETCSTPGVASRLSESPVSVRGFSESECLHVQCSDSYAKNAVRRCLCSYALAI